MTSEPVRQEPVRPQPVRPPLLRPRALALSGVSVALARHLGMPVAGIRWILIGSTVFAALAVVGARTYPALWAVVAVAVTPALLYAWLWPFTPREPEAPDAPRTRAVPVAIVLLVLAAVAALAVVATAGLRTVVPPGAVEAALLACAAIVWSLAVDARDPRRAASAPKVRALAAILLVVLGGALFPLALVQQRPMVAVLSVVLVLLGIAAFVVPLLVERAIARGAERAAAARDEQRSEIAAHLHDSVLQTLAIIQNRAGAGSEVARIARAQERELRDWLFAGTNPFAGDLATELRTMAGELELEHAVRIEVVTVGDVAEVESPALAAAAREALVNAARHAGGEVTVYVEASAASVEVFVRDRGPGFEVEAVPDGRLGIRESIVGRMARAGGTARVLSSADGTEVQLSLLRTASALGRTGAPS